MSELQGLMRAALKKFVSSGTKLAVACSGGPDSMALTLLMQEWALHYRGHIIALIVDHGLRQESATEAKLTASRLASHGIGSQILVWNGNKPCSNIQETARLARYKLLCDYCRQHNYPFLLTAHTQDDQAETFLLRLARGSGVDGLSGIAPLSKMHGITIVRPLLKVSKSDLLNFLDGKQQGYISDPSNENLAFDRVRMRKLLPMLADAGIATKRIADTTLILRRSREYLARQTAALLANYVTFYDEGYAIISHIPDQEEICLRALANIIQRIGGDVEKPRMETLERLFHELLVDNFKGSTLGGCVFAPYKKQIIVYREQAAISADIELIAGAEILWDNRYRIINHETTRLCIGALTQSGWLELQRNFDMTAALPKPILYTLPAIRDIQGALLAVPHLAWMRDSTAIYTINSVYEHNNAHNAVI